MHACLYRELTELKVVDTMYDEIWAALACLLAAESGGGRMEGGVFFMFEVTHGR